MPFRSINPATEELIEEFAPAGAGVLDMALDRAWSGFGKWRGVALGERAGKLRQLAKLLEDGAPIHAVHMAREMGKPVSAGEAEAKKCALCCRYYAEHGPQFLQPEYIASNASESAVVNEPLGPILAIMPWNFPYWQAIRHAAPALMAGNVVLMKPAPSTVRCALALEGAFRDAGFPDGCFQVVLLENDLAAEAIADGRVRGVTLTGSTDAGRSVAALAGRNLKKTVLELGGSDSFVVFADADVEQAAQVAAKARCINSGQSCIAAKRFLVERDALDVFLDGFASSLLQLKMGDPMDPATDIGPLARGDLRENLHRQVEESIALGARLLLGGQVPSGRGWFYPPTLLVDAPRQAPARCEETFGPLALVIPFDDEVEAVGIANETSYGLGASVWTKDKVRGRRVAAGIEAGSVFVNGMVASDPRLPFGGVRDSGYGRELGREGMLEFVNRKTVWVK